MRELLPLAAALAVVLVAAVPALAQDELTNPDTTVGEPPGRGPGEGHGAPPPDCGESKDAAIDCGEPEASSGPPPLPEAPTEPPPLDDGDQAPGPADDKSAGDHGRSGGPADDRGNVEDAGDDDEEGHDTAGPTSDDDDGNASARDDSDQRADAGAKDDDDDDGKDDDDDDDDDGDDEDDVEQDQDQDADSGDVDQSADVINTGDNVNQCVAILQVANTGNAQDQIGVLQDDSEVGEVELEDGSTIDITPQLVLDCRQIIMQVVRGERAREPGKIRTSQVRDGDTQGRVGPAGMVVATNRSGAAPKVASASGAGRPKTLPRTGGFSGSYATLLGLGAGTLLVGGGLVVRRVSR